MHILKEEEKEILCLFDYCCTTGFATVTQNIMPLLKKRFPSIKFTIVAVNFFGDAFMEEGRHMILPASRLEEGTPQQDVFGRHATLAMLKSMDFDGLFIIQDGPVISGMAINIRNILVEKKKHNRKAFKSVFYFPIDCAPYPPDFENLEVFDRLVTYTDFAKKEVLKLYPNHREKIKVIGHGINSKDFYQLDKVEKLKFRQDYFDEHADKFIVTCVNRNQPRKDIPTTIMGFMQYKKEFNDNSFLYLHMTPDDPMGWNLKKLTRQLGLKENKDFKFAPPEMRHAGASKDTMNRIYNASDVFLSTNLGEGWGLTVMEAMACGLPIVAPLHTSMIEMSAGGSRIFGLTELVQHSTTYDSDVRLQSNVYEISEKLNEVFTSPDLVKQKAISAMHYAEYMSWESITDSWEHLFREVFF